MVNKKTKKRLLIFFFIILGVLLLNIIIKSQFGFGLFPFSLTNSNDIIKVVEVYTKDRPLNAFIIIPDKFTYKKGEIATIEDFQDINDGVCYYESIDPKKIIRLMDEKKEKLSKCVNDLILLKETNKDEGGASYFEGKTGVITILNDILDEKKELWFIGSRKKAMQAMQNYPDNFVTKRVDAGIPLRAVMSVEDKGDPSMNDKKVYKISNMRFLEELKEISANIFIYGDKVAFMTTGDNLAGIIIKNKEILKQQRRIFEILWKKAEK